MDAPRFDSVSPQLQRTVRVLSTLSYRGGALVAYLEEIARAVSELIEIDWSAVTLCRGDRETVLASTMDLGRGDQVYALHGTMAETVVRSGDLLAVEDTERCPECGQAPEGYHAYLGVPLRLPNGEVIGTICSFHRTPRTFSADERQIVRLFAERAAIAIDNYELYQQQKSFNARLEAEVHERTAELRAAQDKLLATERLRAIGEFASTIVHEVRSPLSALGMLVEYLSDLDLPEVAARRVGLAAGELARLQDLLSEILLYAKPQPLQREVMEVGRLVEDTLETVAAMAPLHDRPIQYEPCPQTARVTGDRDKLKQVFINLLVNAAEAVGPGDPIRLAVDERTAQGQVCINVQNGGNVVPPDLLSRLTEPFRTTKPGGSGLGLAIVKRIVDAHEGTLTISSSAEAGTRVSVCLPAGGEPERAS